MAKTNIGGDGFQSLPKILLNLAEIVLVNLEVADSKPAAVLNARL